MLEEARPMLEKLGMMTGHKHLTGIFGFFYVLYSILLLHLPPLSSTVSEDAGIESRNAATLALAVRADSLTDDWSLSRWSKPVFDKRDLGETNEQQRHFNE